MIGTSFSRLLERERDREKVASMATVKAFNIPITDLFPNTFCRSVVLVI